MEFQDVLMKRKSIRSYLPKKVEKEKINQIIEAASLAPSWKNSQVSRYYVATGEKTLAKVREALPEFNRKNTDNAPAYIVTTIVANRSGFNNDGTPINELGNGWGFYDCGMNNMTLLLKAAELGLSTLVMGIRDADMLKNILNIPDTEIVVSVIGLGYSEAAPERPKRKTVEELAAFFED